ncbi:cytochrome c oxidase subunit 7A, mitochondrial-like [Onthophagus taurus]|uniref:cytochrome c oxidase subunit 7A, mitochondrial-like n=1 Tax=Onthophagus taurus TaxID=166361 RepID=UPI000C202BDA|nr:uncharacterized protein LOC111423910 [Onthophagus taurus]
MNTSGKTLVLAQRFVRHFGQTAARNSSVTGETASTKFPALKQAQKHFGIEDHVPVYLKGGVGDKIIYIATVGLTLLGLGMSGEVLYKLSFK